MRNDRGSIVNTTLRWVDDHAQSGAEHRAIRQVWANHVNEQSSLFLGCLTQNDVLNVFGDATRMRDEPWIRARSIAHIHRVVARAVLTALLSGEYD